MKKPLPMFGGDGNNKGQTIVENMLCMLIICIILIGFLQIFNIAVAKFLSSYSAYRAARSYSVGFRDFLITRSVRVAGIGASGKIIEPDSQEYGSPMSQFASERLMIPEYQSGARWMEYEYWLGGNTYDYNYYNSEVQPPETTLNSTSYETGSSTVDMNSNFNNYPFALFDLMDKDRVWFDTAGRSRNINGHSELANHALDYLTGD